ncbi:hypothetical protein KRMM14A1259_49080 [Krasilnikovia sp. MM14-A1259]
MRSTECDETIPQRILQGRTHFFISTTGDGDWPPMHAYVPVRARTDRPAPPDPATKSWKDLA